MEEVGDGQFGGGIETTLALSHHFLQTTLHYAHLRFSRRSLSCFAVTVAIRITEGKSTEGVGSVFDITEARVKHSLHQLHTFLDYVPPATTDTSLPPLRHLILNSHINRKTAECQRPRIIRGTISLPRQEKLRRDSLRMARSIVLYWGTDMYNKFSPTSRVCSRLCRRHTARQCEWPVAILHNNIR